MSSKKWSYHQQFLHNSTYIRNLEKEMNYVYIITPLKNFYEESFSIFYFSSSSHLVWSRWCQPGLACVYFGVEVSFAILLI
jgi:hypothetical protein